MRILIDGDGCPVVGRTVAAGVRRGIAVLIFCDTAHLIEREGAQTILCAQGKDSVDLVLVNRLAKGDVVITQDYGLAALCLARGGFPLRQDGLAYTEENIDGLLAMRHNSLQARRAGRRTRGPARRTKGEDEAFSRGLEQLLDRLEKAEKWAEMP